MKKNRKIFEEKFSKKNRKNLKKMNFFEGSDKRKDLPEERREHVQGNEAFLGESRQSRKFANHHSGMQITDRKRCSKVLSSEIRVCDGYSRAIWDFRLRANEKPFFYQYE